MNSPQYILGNPAVRRSEPWTRRELAVFAAMLLFALALRLYFILAVKQPGGLIGDEQYYDQMVKQLLTKGVYGYRSVTPNAYVTPGYPIFLAILYKLKGFTVSPLTTVRLCQALLLTASVGLVYLTARVIGGKRVALFSAVIASLYPPLIWCASVLLTETLFTFVFLAYFYLLTVAFEKRSLVLSGLSGVFFGISVLTRPQVAPFFFIPFAIMLCREKKKSVLAMFTVFTALFAAVMMPWWVRNYITFHKLILSATQTGNPLLAGTDPYYRLGMAKLFKGIKPQDQTGYAIKRIIDGFRNETLLYLKWFTIGKLNIMYGKPWVRFTGGYLRPLVYLHWPVVILGWLGILYAAVKPNLRVLAALVLFVTFIQLIFLPLPRYVFPLVPFLIVAGTCLLADICKALFHRSHRY